MNDTIYTLEEQQSLSYIFDEMLKFDENQVLLLGEDMKYDLFLEEITGGSVARGVRNVTAKKNRIDKKVSKAVDKTVDSAIDGNKKEEIRSIREDLLRGRGKVSTLIKRAIKCAIAGAGLSVAGGAGVSLTPFLALITFCVSTARRKGISEKERDQILFEMKQEMKILDEKISDAQSEGDKKKKYQYMRLKTELERSMGELRKYGRIKHSTLKDVQNEEEQVNTNKESNFENKKDSKLGNR